MILVTGLILIVIAILLDGWDDKGKLYHVCVWLARIGVGCVIISILIFIWRIFP